MKWHIRDTRSEALKQQHKLFQQLGTIARTRSNIANLSKWSELEIGNKEAELLNHVFQLLTSYQNKIHAKMKTLPSKKNKRLASLNSEQSKSHE